eukprot:CAMPEP_0206244798 /NCGR_PEP_ID=MMETSP0047_2-20121206/18353_1 /ASSEMBLY_ACC=CAM_ASM_000192 /TAXON_ID=195065 /ORGANISM="Chroomonas mesostigmatica_cf, Strain CCMP1168" /LENGTH=116 /DNA_ID=CAMNT_0053670049 /DNA_START=54 /DNA_END=404 /DNA_ORIENTATION=+
MSKALLLVTGTPSNEPQKVGQRKLVSQFEAKKIAFEQIDGLDPANKERRSELFEKSGKRGIYPQVFIQDEGGELQFVGDWETFEGLIECDGLPKDVLEANPDIATFTKVFERCARV